MTPTRFDLRFSELEFSNALASAKPPEGVKIKASSPLFQQSQEGFLIVHVVFDFSISVKAGVASGVILTGLARWIVKQLRPKVKRRKDKKARINESIVPLNERNILLIIKKDIAAQIERETQRCKDDANKNSAGENPV